MLARIELGAPFREPISTGCPVSTMPFRITMYHLPSEKPHTMRHIAWSMFFVPSHGDCNNELKHHCPPWKNLVSNLISKKFVVKN